jgi:hypothetical protein
MKRYASLQRYHSVVISQAYQELMLQGIELEPFGSNLKFLQAAEQICRRITKTHHEPRRSGRDPGSPTVRTPVSVPRDGPTPAVSAFSRLQALGTIRGLFVAPNPAGGYKVTLKATIAGRGSVYRYGFVRQLDEVEDLLHHWLDKNHWTPDRQ